MLLVSLPCWERVPPLIFRLTTGGRRLRSAGLLSAPARGSTMKVKSSGRKRSTRWHSILMGVSLPKQGWQMDRSRPWNRCCCFTRWDRRTVSGSAGSGPG